MNERILLVRIFDLDDINIGRGSLLSIKSNAIIVKGNNLPVLDSGMNIIVKIYDELVGISPYLCNVSVASRHQLTAQILRKDPIIERRNALKVRTDLSFYVSKIYRNGDDITDELPNIKINVLNLSIGGMLISSNIDLMLGDVITYYFKYYKYKSIPLEAKIIRIDKLEDEGEEKNENGSEEKNYGCYFISMSSSDEAIILQYLFDRQLQLYRNK
nr:PilZ domain-containing protein [Sedimentibacter sp.]